MSTDNKELAHLWANQSRASANGSHFFFSGDTIFSYGSHFPVARHYKGAVLFTSKRYSSSTARHKSITRSACSHLTVFEVENPLNDPSGKDVKNYGDSIKLLSQAAAKARNPAQALTSLEREIAEANQFCETFGFKTRFSLPDAKTMDALKERAKTSAERERKANAARQAKQEADAKETIAKWLAGETVTIPYSIQRVYLRQEESEMVTSRGACVPIDEAHKAYRFAVVVKAKGWHKNGDQFKVGSYELSAVSESGIVAGCHRITWDEAERFAKLQGWI